MKNNFDVIFGDTRKLGEIKYQFKFFSDYKVIEFNQIYYITGKNIEYKSQTISGIDILISFIELGDIFNDKGYFTFFMKRRFTVDNPDISNFPQVIQAKLKVKLKQFYNDTSTYIIEWCKKYGMPFYEDARMNLLDDNALNFNTGNYGFRLDTFIQGLMWLHSNFYRWRYAEFEEKPSWLKESIKPIESFEWFLSSFSMSGISYEVKYNKKDQCLDFNWVSSDLFSILNFQLALLATRKGSDGVQIKRCAKCNDWFEAYHGNQLYCEKRRGCNAKSVAQAQWRKNKAETENNLK